MFIGFADFYWRFIQGFSRIAVLLTSLLKTTRLSKSVSKAFMANNNEVDSSGGSRANEIIVNLSKNMKSKKLMHMLNIGAMRKPNFLIFNAKKTFNHLWLAFIKALIFRHFDLKSHIQIKTNVTSYAIYRVLSQLNLNSNILLNNLNKSDID